MPKWWPASGGYIPWLSKALRFLVRQTPRATPTLLSLCTAPSSLKSVWMPDDGIPLVFLARLSSPPNYLSHITTTTVRFPYKTPPVPVPLPPYSSPHFPPSPTAGMTSEDSNTEPPSHYCYRWLCIPGMEMSRPDPDALRSWWSTPGLPQNSVVALPV